MAAPLATVLVRYFTTPTDLAAFINGTGNNVATIVAITFDTSSSKYVLFYKTS